MKKLLVFVVVVVFGLWLMGQGVRSVLFSTIFNRPTQGEEVKMLQPNGIFLGRDAQASEINVNNSEANVNNGQYQRSLAEAEFIEAQSDTTKKAYTTNGMFFGGIGGFLLSIICIGGVIALGFVFLLSRNRG